MTYTNEGTLLVDDITWTIVIILLFSDSTCAAVLIYDRGQRRMKIRVEFSPLYDK